MAISMTKKMTGLVHGTCVLLRYNMVMMIYKAYGALSQMAPRTSSLLTTRLVCTITS